MAKEQATASRRFPLSIYRRVGKMEHDLYNEMTGIIADIKAIRAQNRTILWMVFGTLVTVIVMVVSIVIKVNGL